MTLLGGNYSSLLTPIYIQSGGDTFEVLSSTTEAEDATSFWKMLSKELEFFQARGSKEGIGFTSKGEVRLLQLASNLMPTLLGQDGRLRYTEAKDLRINKKDYKNYLETIQANLTELMSKYNTFSSLHIIHRSPFDIVPYIKTYI